MTDDNAEPTPDPAVRSTTHGRATERGASGVEYALLVAGIAVLVVLAVAAFGFSVLDLFDMPCQLNSSC